ncbi:MAG: hypothetical protein ABII09_03720 [Planctomycetota bacterium]
MRNVTEYNGVLGTRVKSREAGRKLVLVMCFILLVAAQAGAKTYGDPNNPVFSIIFDINEGDRIGHEVLVIDEDNKEFGGSPPVITFLPPIPNYWTMSSFVAVDPNRALGRYNWLAKHEITDVNYALVLSGWIDMRPGLRDAGFHRVTYKVVDGNNIVYAEVVAIVKNVDQPAILVGGDQRALPD